MGEGANESMNEDVTYDVYYALKWVSGLATDPAEQD